MVSRLLKAVAAVLGCAALGLLLLCAAYLIPASLMQDECVESLPIMLGELYPQDSLSGRYLDISSDTIILLEASYPGTEPLTERAVASYMLSTGINPHISFKDIYLYEQPSTPLSYSRYWHGYVVVMRPLVVLLNYMQIRTVNTVIQTGLALAVLLLLIKRLRRAAVPFLLMLLFLAPTAIGKTLNFSADYYLMLALCMASLQKELHEKSLMILFLFAGIATAYLDLLTAPTISLTVPLILLCMRGAEDGLSHIENKTLVWCTCLWFFGFAGMWASKWVITYAVQGQASLEALTESIVTRAALQETKTPRLVSLVQNIRQMFCPMMLDVTASVYGLLAAARSAIRLKKGGKARSGLLRLLFPSAVSVLWIILLSEHSQVHAWFTYRTLAPCLLTALVSADYCASPQKM